MASRFKRMCLPNSGVHTTCEKSFRIDGFGGAFPSAGGLSEGRPAAAFIPKFSDILGRLASWTFIDYRLAIIEYRFLIIDYRSSIIDY